MRTTFTEKEFDAFVKKIAKAGYRKYAGGLRSEDYYYCKSLVRETDSYGDSRAVVQLILSVYDWRKYPQHAQEYQFSVQVSSFLSKDADERIETLIMTDRLNTLGQIEKFAVALYGFIEFKYPLKKKAGIVDCDQHTDLVCCAKTGIS